MFYTIFTCLFEDIFIIYLYIYLLAIQMQVFDHQKFF